MNDDRPSVRDLLKRHDPALRREGLTEEEQARMRRAVMRAAGETPAPRTLSDRLLPLVPRWTAAGVLAVLAIGAGLTLWPRQRPAPALPESDAAGLARTTDRSRRELHIVTPGGTQVVWVLDSDFRL
jgi:hypothetical protein